MSVLTPQNLLASLKGKFSSASVSKPEQKLSLILWFDQQSFYSTKKITRNKLFENDKKIKRLDIDMDKTQL